MSSDRPDKFSSDEEEDEDGGWLGGSRFDPGDVDFALADGTAPQPFGFEDQFESATPQAFRASSPDSDDVSLFSRGWTSYAVRLALNPGW